jgi:RNA polymerase II subunit A-like phosphatase
VQTLILCLFVTETQLQDNVDAGVTHVVAAKDGTDKALAARKFPRTVLVKPSWLVECFWSMSRRRSLAHLVSAVSPLPPPPNAKPLREESKMENGEKDSSSSEEDDWAAEFEEELMQD